MELKEEHWYESCEICNAGFCQRMKELVDNEELPLKTAVKKCREEAIEKAKELGFSKDSIPSENSLRSRYKYYTSAAKPKGVEIIPTQNDPVEEEVVTQTPDEEPEIEDEPIEEEESTPTDEGMVFDDTIPGYEEPVETVKRRAKKIKEDMMSPEFASAFDAFLIEIEAARTSSWKYTSKTAIMKCLSILYDAVV